MLEVVTDTDVAERFTLERAYESQYRAFSALGRGEARLAPRILLPGADDSVAFCYVARMTPTSPAVSKFGSVNPRNATRGIDTISATVHVLDGETGRPLAMIAATELTARRTAAASVVALDALAVSGAHTVGIIGTGEQALAHALAVCNRRTVSELRIAGRSPEKGRRTAEHIAGLVPVPVRAVGHETAAGSDIVITCTTSQDAVIETAWVRPGATVVSVGAFAPDRVELPTSLLHRADLVVVDHAATALANCGSVVGAINNDELRADALVELGHVLVGTHPGRGSGSDIVVYLSVGIGVQDAAAAEAVLAATAAGAVDHATAS